MLVSEWLVSRLIELGIERVYCLPGGFVQEVVDKLSHSELQVIWCLDEASAVWAAIGDSQITGQLGVTCTTAGPGSTNLLTGIASAWCDSIPILSICGEINTPELEVKNKYNLREGSAQDVDMTRVARPITKYVECAMGANVVKWIFNNAVKFSLEDRRGPAMVIIPLDVQGAEI